MKEARSSSRLALVIGLVVAIIVACGPDRDDDHTESTKEGLRSNPQLSNFVVYASNSLSLMDRVQIQGGDVGVEHSGTSGPFLVTGYEAALSADSRIDTTRDLLAEDVFLRDRATVGDVEATHITNQFGVYANQYALPTMPAFPSVATPAPGTSSYSVASGQTQTLAAGAFAAVTVNGTLNLSGGTYDFASLSLGNDARLQAQGTTVLHIAGRVSTGDRAHIETTGTTLSAKDFRLEVSGQNGSTGALSASPKAFSLGNDTVVRALIIVPNGTLQTGQRTVATGALFGRDVLVNLDARATFQDGVASQGCGSCDDTNPCTTDACNAGSCTHTPVANGSACDDHNGCTTSDSCQNGACVGGSNVVCQPSNSCHSAGVCDPATGSCSNPPKPDGTACGSNACSPNDHCQGGSCVAGPSTTCMASDACHLAGTCNPSTGVCSNPPAPAGSACGDSNVCTGIEQCDGSGSCVPGIPPTVDDGNPCTIDICDPVLGVIHTPAPSDTSCSDSNACTLGDHCDGAGACVAGTPQTCTSDNACQAAACNPAVGCVTTPIAAGTPCDSDMNQCNGISTCDGAGSCVAGTPPNCTSNDPCMVPSCEPTTGCTLTRAPNGTAGCAPTFEPPPLDQTVSERFSATTAFLYSGTSPVQTGVAPGTIIEKRVAVIRGRVLDADGTTPRAGATVRVLQHPEYGQTLSRDNGEFDLAVNGGAHYVVDISLTGYLPVQRRADVRRWQNWSNLDDVVLTHPVSSPDLFVAASPTAQLVRGIVTPAGEDADGARQAVVLFPENTHATNYAVPDGTPLELQITEFTRGVSGAQRMPGELPASSGYTYAFSIQMPAAAAAGVQDVQFDRDIPIYVDNFTHYPVGEIVPLGYYDRAQGVWTAQQNGRIIKILGVAGGIAGFVPTNAEIRWRSIGN